MSNLSWNVDPGTGDYVMDASGKPVNNADLKTPAYFRLAVKRTKWLYAPDSNYGSDFYLFRKKHLGSDSNLAETVAERALQPLIADGRASAVSATTTGQTRASSRLAVQIVDAQGQPELLNLEQIGV